MSSLSGFSCTQCSLAVWRISHRISTKQGCFPSVFLLCKLLVFEFDQKQSLGLSIIATYFCTCFARRKLHRKLIKIQRLGTYFNQSLIYYTTKRDAVVETVRENPAGSHRSMIGCVCLYSSLFPLFLSFCVCSFQWILFV